MKKGFTLIEILVYIAVLVLMVTAITSFLLWSIRLNTKSKVSRETFDNARRAMEIMTNEIKEAKSIYTPTSIFDAQPGQPSQLSLETTKNPPSGETTTYLDFYLCDEKICLKREGQQSISLTSDKVRVTELVFSKLTPLDGVPSSIRLGLKVEYKAPSDRPEWQSETAFLSTATLRAY